MVAILSCEVSDIFSIFYNFLKNTYNLIPKYLTFDFDGANIKAVNDTFTDKEDINNNYMLISPNAVLVEKGWCFKLKEEEIYK